MAVNTKNAYGNITISDDAIACATGQIALDCYGIIGLDGFRKSTFTSFKSRHKNLSKGVKITTKENRIFIDLYVILKYGLSIATVTENLKSAVKYGIEKFTGMIVDAVNINIVSVRV